MELLERIHATPAQMVMEFAGAGSMALWRLHSLGGSSRTVLEATDRYAPGSLVEAVGFEPERFTSPEVAAALAKRGAARAHTLARPGTPTFGLGLSATIATDRLKRGDHRCEIAVRDAFGNKRFSLLLDKGARDREAEERLISELILLAVADASGVLGTSPPELLPGDSLSRALEPEGAALEFEEGRRDWLLLDPAGAFVPEVPAGCAMLSGSFNPLHHGHLHLAEAASRELGVPVVFELPLVNAEKAAISLAEARRRAAQFLGHGQVLLSRVPLFVEKARIFPGTTFVVGFDTAKRILEARFYGSEEGRREAMAGLRRHGASFLVAGRKVDGHFQTVHDLEVPADATDLIRGLPEDAFREDVSSSEFRREWPEEARASQE